MNKDILDQIHDETIKEYRKDLALCQQELNRCKTELENYKTRCYRYEEMHSVIIYSSIMYERYSLVCKICTIIGLVGGAKIFYHITQIW